MSRTYNPSAREWPQADRSGGLYQRLARQVASIAAFVTERRKRNVAIAELESLDDRMLQDIGINRADISIIVSDAGRRSYD